MPNAGSAGSRRIQTQRKTLALSLMRQTRSRFSQETLTSPVLVSRHAEAPEFSFWQRCFSTNDFS